MSEGERQVVLVGSPLQDDALLRRHGARVTVALLLDDRSARRKFQQLGLANIGRIGSCRMSSVVVNGEPRAEEGQNAVVAICTILHGPNCSWRTTKNKSTVNISISITFIFEALFNGNDGRENAKLLANERFDKLVASATEKYSKAGKGRREDKNPAEDLKRTYEAPGATNDKRSISLNGLDAD